jgi:DNA-binding winged helix-turn-helix (wHTH) protein
VREGLRVLLVGDGPNVTSFTEALAGLGVTADHAPAPPTASHDYDLVLVAADAADGVADHGRDAGGGSLRVPTGAMQGRTAGEATAAGRTAADAIAVDEAVRVVWVRGHCLELTGREYALVHFLVEHPGQVFTRDELLERVWRSALLSDGAVTEYVRRLRMHFAPFGLSRAIRTRHGFGYYFDPDATVVDGVTATVEAQ